MCWICDHPGATERDYTEHMRRLITAYGWAVQGVERDGLHPPWAYTVGLTAHRRAELVITGMGLTRATEVLNGVAAHLLPADEPEPGTQAALPGGPLIEIVRVAVPWAHLNLAVELYGDRIRGLQLVHADKRGNWPWDSRYRGVRGGQPILGRREPPERRKAGRIGALCDGERPAEKGEREVRKPSADGSWPDAILHEQQRSIGP